MNTNGKLYCAYLFLCLQSILIFNHIFENLPKLAILHDLFRKKILEEYTKYFLIIVCTFLFEVHKSF